FDDCTSNELEKHIKSATLGGAPEYPDPVHRAAAVCKSLRGENSLNSNFESF
ncbi:MAG: hypothetical protein RL078_1394, partial [Bacteroidota bacterium]